MVVARIETCHATSLLLANAAIPAGYAALLFWFPWLWLALRRVTTRLSPFYSQKNYRSNVRVCAGSVTAFWVYELRGRCLGFVVLEVAFMDDLDEPERLEDDFVDFFDLEDLELLLDDLPRQCEPDSGIPI